jgi:hypothetical protein
MNNSANNNALDGQIPYRSPVAIAGSNSELFLESYYFFENAGPRYALYS